MKKLLSINSCNYGSTGTIMNELCRMAEESGFVTYKAIARSRTNKPKSDEKTIFIGSLIGRNIHLLLSRYTGYNGCFSHIGTYLFLRKVKKIKPDVIHLHNLHNSYINLSMLFKFIKKHNIKTIWTLHDCWSFTGKCPHFLISKCDKWETECYNCPSLSSYPVSRIDKTKKMHSLKKKWFTGVKDMTIVTPSNWLSDLVKKSFLNDYPVKVINNGIDLSVFKPTESNFRKVNNLEDKFIILGVASPFTNAKGFDVFIELSQRLDISYKIVLVGLSKEQLTSLPSSIIGIERTSNKEDLVKIYSAADLFVNPTREEVLGLVNIEAIACGTPVVTFNSGGSPECVNESCGVVVPNFLEPLIDSIEYIKRENPFAASDCIKYAENFCNSEKYEEYINLYLNLG